MTTKKLHIWTPKGKILMPQDWVYKTNKEKNEWLTRYGFQEDELDEQPQVQIYLEAV